VLFRVGICPEVIDIWRMVLTFWNEFHHPMSSLSPSRESHSQHSATLLNMVIDQIPARVNTASLPYFFRAKQTKAGHRLAIMSERDSGSSHRAGED